MRRVVVTGYGAVTPLGYGVDEFLAGLQAGLCATVRMTGWDKYGEMASQVGAPVALRNAREIPRKFRRTMSPMSIFAVQATQQALAQAGLAVDEIPEMPNFGVVMGSTTGSPQTTTATYETLLAERNYALLGAAEFFRCVAHTVALNVSQMFGVRGMVLATSAACASSLQAIGCAVDLIRCGRQDIVVCGGGEELHQTTTGSFDILYAGSAGYNDRPSETPRPFDAARDGLVCGEGAGAVVLEEYEHAVSRGAPILAEVCGYHTCGNGKHVSQSDAVTMLACMKRALDDAGLTPAGIAYVSAHATGTLQGDAAEASAIGQLFGDRVPVSSLKGNIGHTLGASGVIELIASIEMMRRGRLFPTHNLDDVASDCQGVDHVREQRDTPVQHFLKNSFAFGGINAALVCGRPD